MRNLKTRLDRIEQQIGAKKEFCILIAFPGKPGFSYDGRTFKSVEAAVESFKRKRGQEIEPHVITIVPARPRTLEEDSD
jgi:hypothetical protein